MAFGAIREPGVLEYAAARVGIRWSFEPFEPGIRVRRRRATRKERLAEQPGGELLVWHAGELRLLAIRQLDLNERPQGFLAESRVLVRGQLDQLIRIALV